MDLKVAGIVEESIVDGPGIRYTVFTQGCHHNCPGCHNPESHSLSGGFKITHSEIMKDITSNPLLTGVTFSGGEPFLQLDSVLELCYRIKEETDLNIYVYTGFTIDELLDDNKAVELLKTIDFLIDGPYIEDLKDELLKFKGSSNQRIINVKEYLTNKI